MNHDRLRLDLADLADEVNPVDLRDRALRTSRRLGIRRAVATSAAVVALIGAAAGTAFAVIPRADGPAPLPADSPSVISASPAPVPTADPAPSAPSTGAPVTTEKPDVTPEVGKLFYGPDYRGGFETGGSARLQSWRPGTKPAPLLSLPHEAALLNATVAPDGRRVAWVDQSTLWVAGIDGSDKRELRGEVDNMCTSPAWSPDSRQLLAAPRIAADRSGIGLVDVSSGRFTEVDGIGGCHPVWAAGGAIAIADGTDGTVVLTDQDGKGRRTIPRLGKGHDYISFDLSSLSPDGRRIALGRSETAGTWGDAARSLRVNVVLDTRTGEEVALELGGRELRQAYFQADGTLVARVRSGTGYALVLLDADGRKISESAEPAALKDMQILAVVG
ncbi:hypothetical protein [Salinispora arenicola]|uniref:hypothetical protein n=1 Tax=Salinispora arenicola TaxID=168697 RepID=UPI0027DD82C0|nr:hypothetical protein [Salinispora arenicola]